MTMHTGKTDQELARAAVAGDRSAFEAVVSRYSRPLAEFAARKTNTVQDAEDIVQETFLRAYVNLGSFDGRFSLKNWLFTIAYRLIISGYRKKKPQLVEDAVLASAAVRNEDRTDGDWVWDEVALLASDVQTALLLRYKQGMEIDEIAHVMGKSGVGVRVLLHRARRRLAERIDQSRPDRVSAWQAQDKPIPERIKR